MVKIEKLNNNHNRNELVKLSLDFFNEYQDHHEEFFDHNITEDQITSYFDSFIGKNDKIAFVGIHEDAIVAYLTAYVKWQAPFYKIKKIGDISGLMVKKENRRMGIATMLMDNTIYFFREQGVEYYELFTSTENTSAIEFYKNFDMKPMLTTLVGKTHSRKNDI